jgi:hypothetical protein
MIPKDENDGKERTPLLLTDDEKLMFSGWVSQTTVALNKAGEIMDDLSKRLIMLEDIQQAQVAAALGVVAEHLDLDEKEEKEERGDGKSKETSH